MPHVNGPLIVQSDRTVLLEVANPEAQSARHELAVFAELERAPEHMHSYRITRLGLWNARAAGHSAEEILDVLTRYSKFDLPANVVIDITETISRYGKLKILRDEGGLVLQSIDQAVLREVSRNKKIVPMLVEPLDESSWRVADWSRGELKQQLLKLGWPAEDLAGFTAGANHDIELVSDGWELRNYQLDAVSHFIEGGNGVVVLPCGAGKTLVGAAVMAELDTNTLILVTNTVSARQWRSELLARTSLSEDDIGEYSGEVKEIKPVTIATYQILSAKRAGKHRHLELLDALDWGLVVYDEVHLLPAPVFKLTAELQSRRRLGLTATLVREDGREDDVFSLIGPKRFDAPWKELEAQGYIASAECFELRVDLSPDERLDYAIAEDRERYRIGAISPSKTPVIKKLLAKHVKDQVLIIGQFLEQLDTLAEELQLPKITGQTPIPERERLYQEFREGHIKALIVSKVANFSIDLPDANVAIQISGSFGSRQEEAQRLGRILRPKSDGGTATFYTLVARDTSEQDFAQNRQRFLTEQGYGYSIHNAREFFNDAASDTASD
ncbi:MAG: DNA repair helicase XPB [Microbacteriaceae bacterium]